MTDAPQQPACAFARVSLSAKILTIAVNAATFYFSTHHIVNINIIDWMLYNYLFNLKSVGKSFAFYVSWRRAQQAWRRKGFAALILRERNYVAHSYKGVSSWVDIWLLGCWVFRCRFSRWFTWWPTFSNCCRTTKQVCRTDSTLSQTKHTF